MIARETRLWMRNEKKHGVPVARIARKYGVSRQTVYNILEACSTAPRPRKPRGSILDPYKDGIRAKLEEFDVPVTTVFEDIKKLGYPGSMTIVKDFVRDVKGDLVRQVIERFETLPGRQAQVDWGECGTITVNGQRRKLYVFVLVLGYSRTMFARFTTSMRQPALLTVLREAVELLGVPQELLVDNMKTAVDHHAHGEAVKFNSGFLDFCDHYGTAPVACPPYWPRAKGKVESGVKYVKTSFLTGRTFETIEDLNEQLDAWLDATANVRVHGTTGERPVDRYAREVEFLRPTAAVPRFDTRELLLRKVQADSHIRFENVAYSVPPAAVEQTVHLRTIGTAVGTPFEVLLGTDVIASHTVAARTSGRVTLPEHERLIKAAAAKARKPRRPKAMFHQRAPQDPGTTRPHGHQHGTAAPVVQTPSLSEYDRHSSA